MKVRRVLLALPAAPRLLREALRLRLESAPNLHVVGEVIDELDLLVAIGETEADVVIHSLRESASAVHSHLFEHYPSLKVIGLTETLEAGFFYERPVVVTPWQGALMELLSAISPGAELEEESL